MGFVSTSSLSNYWGKIPLSLRLIIKARLWTAIGAGGVLYLSPIIFNSLDFTAEQIGSGITTAAFSGIITRFLTGYLLDKKYSYEDAISLYQNYISSVNTNQKKDWDQLHQYAAKMYQELLQKIQ